MTDIDPAADVEIDHGDEHMTARIPLAGPVDQEWLRCYQKLARARDLPAAAEEHPGRAWIVVRVPASDDHDEVLAMLDTARTLIAEADAVAEQPRATAYAEAAVREWWALRGRPPTRMPTGSG